VLIGGWAVAATIATSLNPNWVQRAERLAQVAFYRLRGSVSPPHEIVILQIDQDSFVQGEFYQADPDRYPELEPIQTWPWQRTAYAVAIEKLMAAGARSVSLDIILADPSVYGSKDDQRFQQVLQRYRDRVVLAAEYATFGTDGITQAQIIYPNPAFPVSPTAYGLINFLLEPDGRVYRLNTRYYDEVIRPVGLLGEAIPAFAVATLRAAQIAYPIRSSTASGEIFYYGGAGTFEQVPFWHILDPTNWQIHVRRGTFRNKIVLVGATATTLQDFARTPIAEMMPGIEVHANSIATLMQDRTITAALPNAYLRGLLVLLGVTGTGMLLSSVIKRPVVQLLAALATAVLWGSISYLCFTGARLTLPTVLPMIAIGLGGISNLTTAAINNQLEQRRLRHTLERYVAAPILNEILTQHSDDFQALLKGRRVKAAVLFCDIRGFTAFSLQLEPEQLIEQLNVYLNAMVEVILETGGTVDKFIGDAVMAEFGSPISHGEKTDAMNAIQAALKMRRSLAALHQRWQQQGQALFFNGIGINYGEAIAGDIGSYRRREYALIGDAVNVASRVEALTRQFATDILITESLYELVEGEVEVICIGEHALKGRGENLVRLYILIGLKGEDQTLYQQVQEKLRMSNES
jgi:adenylate cyclase